MTDDANRNAVAKLEAAKLHLASENESVVRRAMQQHEGLVDSWLHDWRLKLFPDDGRSSVEHLGKKKRASTR
jgi:hypothetical protein